jgi:hypothetical protein
MAEPLSLTLFFQNISSDLPLEAFAIEVAVPAIGTDGTVIHVPYTVFEADPVPAVLRAVTVKA